MKLLSLTTCVLGALGAEYYAMSHGVRIPNYSALPVSTPANATEAEVAECEAKIQGYDGTDNMKDACRSWCSYYGYNPRMRQHCWGGGAIVPDLTQCIVYLQSACVKIGDPTSKPEGGSYLDGLTDADITQCQNLIGSPIPGTIPRDYCKGLCQTYAQSLNANCLRNGVTNLLQCVAYNEPTCMVL
eukprot:Blabericola_migrator_1__9528@NODE_5184_length_850_cov_3582_342273_g3300_i0_p1_GENE_NODE_5184_length_850_cov_3582_342273_g3300_i0NODE_5184_length_850_cov_3582_342273_g3300_i0_p1_ORF_typecomplete_len186_score29_67_NODE_5184_length_850_cov_3582_342273_g3300_i0195752